MWGLSIGMIETTCRSLFPGISYCFSKSYLFLPKFSQVPFISGMFMGIKNETETKCLLFWSNFYLKSQEALNAWIYCQDIAIADTNKHLSFIFEHLDVYSSVFFSFSCLLSFLTKVFWNITDREFPPWDSAVSVEVRHWNLRLGASKQSLCSILGPFSEVGHMGLVLSVQAMTSQWCIATEMLRSGVLVKSIIPVTEEKDRRWICLSVVLLRSSFLLL